MRTHTTEQRAELKAQLEAVNLAMAPVFDAMKPLNAVLVGLQALRDTLLATAGVTGEYLECEDGHLILPGDKYHSCDDGPLLCEACAPTYADSLKQVEECIACADGSTGDDDLQEWKESRTALMAMTPEQLAEKNVQVHDG